MSSPSSVWRAARAVDPRLGGWVVSLAITGVAAALRFWHLGHPALLFGDEWYYAMWSWSLIHHGYVTWPVPHAAVLVNAGITVGVFTGKPFFPVHPPTGMWLIGAGESVFGMTPVGWRVSSAIAGTLIVLVVIRLLRRLTGSMVLAGAGGLFLAFDGLELMMSRLGMLDVFLTLFLLVAVTALVADRQSFRQRLDGQGGSGTRLWWRPWRLVAGVSFGLAVSTKWSALLVIAVFGIATVWWEIGDRRRIAGRRGRVSEILRAGPPAFGYLVVVAFVVYLASWGPWLAHAHEIAPDLAYPVYGGSFWGEWVDTPPRGVWDGSTYALRALWHYHQDMYRFHTVTLGDRPQWGTSPAWGWPLLTGPYLQALYTSTPALQPGCVWASGGTCSVGVLGLGTPLLWWMGDVALLAGGYLMVVKRDWRIWVPVLALLSVWVPWMAEGGRPVYSYYAVAMIPFTVIVLVLVLGRWMASRGPAAPIPARRRVVLVVLVVLVAANFAWEWPLWTFQPLSRQGYVERAPFPTWQWDFGGGGDDPSRTVSVVPSSGRSDH